MKKLFFSLVAVMIATVSFAQSNTLAILSHNGNLSTFYGSRAFRDAMNAAENGDVITLSSGNFEATNITKAVTIRGAGMETDSVTKTTPTIITNNFNIDVPDTIEHKLTIEGIYHNQIIYVYHQLSNATFMKCRLYAVAAVYGQENGYGYMKNVSFVHCKIANDFNQANGSNSVSFVNCYVANLRLSKDYSNTFEFSNCVVQWTNFNGDNWRPWHCGYSVFRNCIIIAYNPYPSYSEQYRLPTTSYVYNCVGINQGDFSDLFYGHENRAGETFSTTNTVSSIFKTFSGSYSDNASFELTDEAKTKYLGDDGKEVGMYGGNLPYSPEVLSPRITKCNVASKTTADGKLSVDMEVKVAE